MNGKALVKLQLVTIAGDLVTKSTKGREKNNGQRSVNDQSLTGRSHLGNDFGYKQVAISGLKPVCNQNGHTEIANHFQWSVTSRWPASNQLVTGHNVITKW